jgi:hypothetical protein
VKGASEAARLVVVCWLKPLDLVLKVASRDHGTEDFTGIPHDGVRCALLHELGELFEDYEVTGLRGRVVEEGPERGRSIERPDRAGLVCRASGLVSAIRSDAVDRNPLAGSSRVSSDAGCGQLVLAEAPLTAAASSLVATSSLERLAR